MYHVILSELCGPRPLLPVEAGDIIPVDVAEVGFGHGRASPVFDKPAAADRRPRPEKNRPYHAPGRRVWHEQEIRTVAAPVKSKFLRIRAGECRFFDHDGGYSPARTTAGGISEWRQRMASVSFPPIVLKHPIRPKNPNNPTLQPPSPPPSATPPS